MQTDCNKIKQKIKWPWVIVGTEFILLADRSCVLHTSNPNTGEVQGHPQQCSDLGETLGYTRHCFGFFFPKGNYRSRLKI